MAIELPEPIARYFSADRGKAPGAVAECFAEGAVVVDEGNTYTGRDAICRWKADSATKYTYTVEPFAIAQDGEKTIVTSRLTGNFPGSPVDLRYLFDLQGGKIAGLEIVP